MSNQEINRQLQDAMQVAQEAFERFKKDTRLQEHLQAELERFKLDTRYAEQHRQELLERYPEQWVAVYNQEVVGANADYKQLLEVLMLRNVPIEKTVFEHLTRKPEVWIL
jgi:hypothetical protein